VPTEISRLFVLGLLAHAILLFLGAPAARADQCPPRESPIETDRPDVTNSSLVVPQDAWQSENGVGLSRRHGGDAFDGTNSRLRFGVAPCLEILLDVPSYFAAVHGPGDSGFTDTAPAVKWQISPVPGKFDLAATFGAALPTGAKAIAGRGVQPYLQWPWSLDLGGGWSLAGMLTNAFTPANAGDKVLTETTFLIERAFAERAFIFVEYVGDYRAHGEPSLLLDAGGGYRITPAQQIDFHLGMGLNANAPTYLLGVGYSFRVGGLF
jgi:hypothetical protein